LVAKELPMMYPLINALYENDPTLFFNTRNNEVRELPMEQGFMQGDVFSTCLYSLCMAELHQEMNKVAEKTDAFVDDTFSVAQFEKIVEVLELLKSDLAKESGYHLNDKKTVVLMGKAGDYEEAMRRKSIYIDDHNLNAHNVLMHPADIALEYGENSIEWRQANREWGVRILGANIGSNQYCTNQLQSKLSELQEEAHRLVKHTCKQDCMVLLQWCFNAKINHIMRTTDPTLLAPFLHGFSETQRQIVQYLIESEVSDAQLERMKLPINQGGFDLGFQEITSCAAYVSSLVGVQHTLRTIPGIDLEEQSIPLLMRMGECVEAMQEVIPNINKQTIWANACCVRMWSIFLLFLFLCLCDPFFPLSSSFCTSTYRIHSSCCFASLSFINSITSIK